MRLQILESHNTDTGKNYIFPRSTENLRVSNAELRFANFPLYF